MTSILRRRLLASTLIIGAASFAAPAWAQPVDEDTQENPAEVTIDEDAGEGTESIVVTGSRIQRRDLTSTSPLAVVQDEEFKLSGAVNVEQVINTLPQAIPGSTSFDNNPGGGVATLNLRGLGTPRTLVLVNGRRWMFFDAQQIVDLNTIPTFLLDSVDVVTGGASAVYGSDAIAGVVNFRLKEDLEGLEIGSSYAITERGDGGRFNAHMAMGAQFADGRGNVTAFAEYFKRRSIFGGGDREFSRFAMGEGDGVLVPLGSSTLPQGRFTAPGSSTVASDLNGDGDTTDPGESIVFNRAVGTRFFADNGGAFFGTPGATSTAYNPDTDSYNYAPSNYLQVPQERWLLGGYGSYEISDRVTAFAEVAFVNNRVENELAPTPVTGTYNFDIDAISGFLSPADVALLQQLDAAETAINAERAARGLAPLFGVGTFGVLDAGDEGVVQLGVNRRAAETGARNQADDRNAFRVLAGVKGPVFADWTYEAYYSFARTRNAQIQSGNISRTAFQTRAEQGLINIFGPDTLTDDDLADVTILTQNQDISELQVANAAVSGTLGNFGWGAEDIGLALGAEWRSMRAQFIPDTALSSGDVIGFNGGDPTEGGYNVKEVFGEVRIPVLAEQPFFHRLEVNGAARYSDYSLEAVGSTWTYAAGAEWAPIPDISFRGQYQRAVRAPNVGELFGGQGNGFPPATDPCSDRGPAASRTEALRQLCIQTGVPAAAVFTRGVQPDSQIEGVFGGNPDLEEETSDTYTLGAVVRPRFIPRLNIAVDYFNIKVQDVIDTFGGGLPGVLDLCYNQIADVNSVYCQAIIKGTDRGPGRNPETGEIGDVNLVPVLNANVAELATSGVDLQVDYSLPLNFGLMDQTSRLNLFFLGTYTEKFAITPVAELPDDINDCAGRFGLICGAFGSGQPISKYKWTSRLTWMDGPVTTSVRWRHLSAVTDDDDDSDFVVERIDAQDYFDLAFSFDVTDQFTFSAGVNNLLDNLPPQIGDNQEQANTYPSTYDPLGRDFFVSALFRF